MRETRLDLTQTNAELKKQISKLHPLDLAENLLNLTEAESQKISKILTVKQIAQAFPYLEREDGINYFNTINIKQKKSLLNALEVDELEAFIDPFSPEEQEKLIQLIHKNKQETIKMLLSYDDKLAASLMTTEFVKIDIEKSIKEATAHVIENTDENTYIDTIFITKDDKYYGAISIKDLIIARANTKLEKIINPQLPIIYDDTNIFNAVHKIKDYDINVIPVLNKEEDIIGIITADDIFEQMALKHEKVYQHMVAVGEDYDEQASPLKRSINRLPWLILSVVLNLVIAGVLSVFERTLSEVVALVLFQPMILGMAGNIGTQSLAVTILGLNKKNIETGKHITKETFIAIINGLLTGIFGFLIVLSFLSILQQGSTQNLMIAIVVGISLTLSMIISALAGVFLPLILNKYGFDEKAASGPLISTINDFSALGIYFITATILLINLV